MVPTIYSHVLLILDEIGKLPYNNIPLYNIIILNNAFNYKWYKFLSIMFKLISEISLKISENKYRLKWLHLNDI